MNEVINTTTPPVSCEIRSATCRMYLISAAPPYIRSPISHFSACYKLPCRLTPLHDNPAQLEDYPYPEVPKAWTLCYKKEGQR